MLHAGIVALAVSVRPPPDRALLRSHHATVDLDLAPLYFRVMGEAPTQSLITHTGYPVAVITQAATDAAGNVWLMSDLGPGCIDDRDLGALDLIVSESAQASAPTAVLRLLGDHAVWPLNAAPSIAFGFDPRPR